MGMNNNLCSIVQRAFQLFIHLLKPIDILYASKIKKNLMTENGILKQFEGFNEVFLKRTIILVR